MQQSTNQKSATTQFQLINYHLGKDQYSMITDKNNCCNGPTLVQSRQRSQNDMTERLYVFIADVL